MSISLGDALTRAIKLHQQGDFDSAIKIYKLLFIPSIQDDPDFFKVIAWNMGACYMGMNDPMSAARVYKKYLEKNATDDEFLSNFSLAVRTCLESKAINEMELIRGLISFKDINSDFLHKVLFVDLFSRLTNQLGTVRFLDIGANDGVTFNPIRPYVQKYNWTGILIEPNPPVFRKLSINYNYIPNVYLENCCIGPTAGEAAFYVVRNPQELNNPVVDQISSLNKDHVLSHLRMFFPERADLESLIDAVPVRIRVVDDILESRGFENIDVLIVDAEGYDFEILRSINFSKLTPTIIIFESRHIPSHHTDALHNLLDGAGFDLVPIGADGLAIRKGFVSDEALGLYRRFSTVLGEVDHHSMANQKAYDVITRLRHHIAL